jgi:hypothetical protein
MLGLLLVLQVQQVAAGVLDCLHDGSPRAGGCPLHHATAPADSPASFPGALLDCQRCVLEATIGAAQPLIPTLPVRLSLLVAVDPPPARQPHFYRFDPDSPLRPPINPPG